jgi:hypothetical protein
MSVKSKTVPTDAVKCFLFKYRARHEDVRKNFHSSYEAGQAAAAKRSRSNRSSADKDASDDSQSTEDDRPPVILGKEQHGLLSLPKLTEEEANSHLGASLGYLMGLLISLEQQLIAQRAANQLSSFRKISASSASSMGAAAPSIGATMATMHTVREQVRQLTSDAATASTAPSTATIDTTTAASTVSQPPEDERNDVAESSSTNGHHQSMNDHSEEPVSPSAARARLMLQRHGSIDISSFDGMEENEDEENIFNFLSSI